VVNVCENDRPGLKQSLNSRLPQFGLESKLSPSEVDSDVAVTVC